MSRASEQAEQLMARDEAGEKLPAIEWSSLSVFHANEAIRHAESGVRWAVVSFIASAAAFTVLLVRAFA